MRCKTRDAGSKATNYIALPRSINKQLRGAEYGRMAETFNFQCLKWENPWQHGDGAFNSCVFQKLEREPQRFTAKCK